METNEHKDAGDKIRIETLDNHYLKGSKNLSTDSSNNLCITMMHKLDDVPMPLELELSAGDIVALAGDYYTKAGWGAQLNIPAKSDADENQQLLLHKGVQTSESSAFRQAYDDLASPLVTQKEINRIYAIDGSRFIPNLIKQLIYTFTVKDYGKKLSNNEAHFSPWSLRAYIVGHHSALQMAEMAYYCHAKAQEAISKENIQIPAAIREQLVRVEKQIALNPAKYKLQNKTPSECWAELGHRYHALAVARDLFAMHFYSDHFAGGHLSRLGRMRAFLPQRFGVWGSILVNNMHNEDNEKSVAVTNSVQGLDDETEQFQMIREDSMAYGDGTYFNHDNAGNSNMLINGMDNSLGDIARLMMSGEKRQSSDYGGLTFLPEIDYSKAQPQPLFIYGPDEQIYFRSDLKHIKMLSSGEYKNTAQKPLDNGYQTLTSWNAFLLVVKLRVLAPFYTSKIVPNISSQEMNREEAVSAPTEQKKLMKQSVPGLHTTFEHKNLLDIGQWRHNSITPFLPAKLGFLANPSKHGVNVHSSEEQTHHVADSSSMF